MFAGFYERRARRILPALFVMIAFCLVVGWFLMLPTPYKMLNNSAFAAVLSASNFYFWRQTGYFAQASDLFPLLHTWSLAVEEQFYIFLPIFLVIWHRLQRSMLVGAVALVCLASFALSAWGLDNIPSATFFLLPTRAWELGIGSLLALCHPLVTVHRAWRELLAWAGTLAIILPILLYSPQTPFPGFSALLPCLGAALIIWTGTNTIRGRPQTSVSWLLSLQPAVFVGLHIVFALFVALANNRICKTLYCLTRTWSHHQHHLRFHVIRSRDRLLEVRRAAFSKSSTGHAKGTRYIGPRFSWRT